MKRSDDYYNFEKIHKRVFAKLNKKRIKKQRVYLATTPIKTMKGNKNENR